MTIPLSSKVTTKSVATRTTRAVPPVASSSRASRAPEPPAQLRAAEARNGKRKRDPVELAFVKPPAKKHAPARPTNPPPTSTKTAPAAKSNGAGPSRPTKPAAASPATTRAKRPTAAQNSKVPPPEISKLFMDIKQTTAKVAEYVVRSHQFSRRGTRPAADEETIDMVEAYVGESMVEKLRKGHEKDQYWVQGALQTVIAAQVYCAVADCDVAQDADTKEHLGARVALSMTVRGPEKPWRLQEKTRRFYAHKMPTMSVDILVFRTIELVEAVLEIAGGASSRDFRRVTRSKIKRIINDALKLRELCGEVGSAEFVVFYPYPETDFMDPMMEAEKDGGGVAKKIFCATSVGLMRMYVDEGEEGREMRRSVRKNFRAGVIAIGSS